MVEVTTVLSLTRAVRLNVCMRYLATPFSNEISPHARRALHR